MRVLQVGPGEAWTQWPSAKSRRRGVVPARQLKRRVRATGGAGHNAHTKGVTGLTRLNEVVGRWSRIPPARFLTERELRSAKRAWGQAALRVKAANALELLTMSR